MIEHYYAHIELLVEALTTLISLVGVLVCFAHGIYFHKIKKEKFAVKMRDNFLWDSALYAVTFIMGFALFMDWQWLVRIDMVIRPFVLLMAVIASVRLYKHYKTIHANSSK